MENLLTAGAIEAIFEGQSCETLKPVLQILGLKKMAQASNQVRHRLMLSDGVQSTSYGMLASTLNDMVASGHIATHCIVRVTQFVCNKANGDKRIIMISNLEVLKMGAEVNVKLGNPINLKHGSGGDEPMDLAPAAAPPQSTYNRPLAPVVKSEVPLLEKVVRPGSGLQNPSAAGARSPMMSVNGQLHSGQAEGLPKTPGGGQMKVYQIVSLTPYQNKWMIKARVSQKSTIRTYSNSKGEGKFFNVNFVDESGEIRATVWKADCDKFFDLLEVNKVYYVSKAMLKAANKQFSSVNNDYEMSFTSDTSVVPCDEEDSGIPSLQFHFVPLSDLTSLTPSSLVDVIGVVKNAMDVTTITAKSSQKEVTKRDIELVDKSTYAIRLTLWGEDARNFDGSSNPVLAVKGCRLSDWNGRSLSAVSSSTILLNPDIPEAHELRGWYDAVGSKQSFSHFQSDGAGAGGSGGATSWKTFEDVKSENLGSGDKADYFMVKATVVFMKKENCMYMACPNEGCNKKLIDNGNGIYKCERCSRDSSDYKWRMILQANLADVTGNQWVTCFQESAEAVLSERADNLGNLRQTNEARFDAVFIEATYKTYTFKLRAKMETYNDENRVKIVCMEAKPVNLVENNAKLIRDIEALANSL